MVVPIIIIVVLSCHCSRHTSFILSVLRKVDQGHALIINKFSGEPKVTFTGGIVIPIAHRAEIMDISVKTIEVDRHGQNGLICADNIRADIKVTFFVKVNKDAKDVICRVAPVRWVLSELRPTDAWKSCSRRSSLKRSRPLVSG